jgi:hypothetical protein
MMEEYNIAFANDCCLTRPVATHLLKLGLAYELSLAQKLFSRLLNLSQIIRLRWYYQILDFD